MSFRNKIRSSYGSGRTTKFLDTLPLPPPKPPKLPKLSKSPRNTTKSHTGMTISAEKSYLNEYNKLFIENEILIAQLNDERLKVLKLKKLRAKEMTDKFTQMDCSSSPVPDPEPKHLEMEHKSTQTEELLPLWPHNPQPTSKEPQFRSHTATKRAIDSISEQPVQQSLPQQQQHPQETFVQSQFQSIGASTSSQIVEPVLQKQPQQLSRTMTKPKKAATQKKQKCHLSMCVNVDMMQRFRIDFQITKNNIVLNFHEP